jgi:GNAT superfamily N-acetyltransferase
LEDRVANGEAVLAFLDGEFVGAGYLKTWENGRFLSQSGVVVDPKARRMGIASAIKARVMEVSLGKHPDATCVSLTLSPAIEKMNRALGFRNVSYADLPQGDDFWEGCKTCPYYETLVANQRVTCNCAALRLDPGAGGGETPAP